MRKSYGERLAVDGVSLEVPAGTGYGLLGPNGAGKSTLISMIAGTLDADGGSVAVAGDPMGRSYLAAKRRLGYVPQDLALYEDLNAQDNLRFFGSLFDMGRADLARAIDRALEIVGLGDRRREPVRRFSGGMKRRLNLAAALLHDPEVLVLDEPTVGVDPQSRNLIFETLERLIGEGKTVLYTTHYMEEVERLCSSVAIMDGGRVIADGKIAGLLESLPGKRRLTIQSADLWDLSAAGLDPRWEPELEGRRLTVRLTDVGAQLPALITAVRAVTVIEEVTTERSTLEEVFLSLTGRTLRD